MLIDQLFSIGKVITKAPFRLVYLDVEKPTFEGVQILISIPKKRFKLAVSRNRIRRQTSEVFRLNADELLQTTIDLNKHVAIGIIYIGKKEIEYTVLEEKLSILLQELSVKLKK